MTVIALLNPDDDRDPDAMTTEELIEALKACFAVTAKAMSNAGKYIRVLEGRGVDIQSFKLPWMKEMRLVAHGQLHPEVCNRFGGNRLLLDAVTRLPMPDQERLASGEPVLLLVHTSDGQPTHRLADPRDLRSQQIRQVFGRDGIRAEAAQALYLDDERRKRREGRPVVAGPMKLDHERKCATHKGEVITLADLVAAVKALQS